MASAATDHIIRHTVLFTSDKDKRNGLVKRVLGNIPPESGDRAPASRLLERLFPTLGELMAHRSLPNRGLTQRNVIECTSSVLEIFRRYIPEERRLRRIVDHFKMIGGLYDPKRTELRILHVGTSITVHKDKENVHRVSFTDEGGCRICLNEENAPEYVVCAQHHGLCLSCIEGMYRAQFDGWISQNSNRITYDPSKRSFIVKIFHENFPVCPFCREKFILQSSFDVQIEEYSGRRTRAVFQIISDEERREPLQRLLDVPRSLFPNQRQNLTRIDYQSTAFAALQRLGGRVDLRGRGDHLSDRLTAFSGPSNLNATGQDEEQPSDEVADQGLNPPKSSCVIL